MADANKMREALESLVWDCKFHGVLPRAVEKAEKVLAEQPEQGEAVAWRAYGTGQWSDGLPSQSSIEYYGTNLEYAYAVPPAPRVPDGWKLVPAEPTEEMVEAAYDNVTGGGGRAAIYAALLAAAPEPPR